MRGYQKRVIYLKNTGSSLFEGAYFIMKPDSEKTQKRESEMVDEANRIIKENFKSDKKIPAFLWHAVSFLFGAVLSSVIFIFVF